MPDRPSVLITGASTGIGAAYANRFARRGHGLILVARRAAQMQELATRLRQEAGVAVDIMPADLTQAADLEQVEARLQDDARIGVLVNNAGASLAGGFTDQRPADVGKLVALNVGAVARLAAAVAPRFVAEGGGAIINIASVVGLVPEFGMTVYDATKAFVTFLSQGLAHELGPKGVYVQAVLPAGTRTDIWNASELPPERLAAMMDVGVLVDAALAGFDCREAVTIPVLTDPALWEAYQAARKALIPDFGRGEPAARYRA